MLKGGVFSIFDFTDQDLPRIRQLGNLEANPIYLHSMTYGPLIRLKTGNLLTNPDQIFFFSLAIGMFAGFTFKVPKVFE